MRVSPKGRVISFSAEFSSRSRTRRPQKAFGSTFHAFQLLLDDCSAGRPKHSGGIRALSTGQPVSVAKGLRTQRGAVRWPVRPPNQSRIKCPVGVPNMPTGLSTKASLSLQQAGNLQAASSFRSAMRFSNKKLSRVPSNGTGTSATNGAARAFILRHRSGGRNEENTSGFGDGRDCGRRGAGASPG